MVQVQRPEGGEQIRNLLVIAPDDTDGVGGESKPAHAVCTTNCSGC